MLHFFIKIKKYCKYFKNLQFNTRVYKKLFENAIFMLLRYLLNINNYQNIIKLNFIEHIIIFSLFFLPPKETTYNKI